MSITAEDGLRRRVIAVDVLRGLVMVLMTLDHVRDYFHADALAIDPLDPTQTSVPLYLTRWITHLCAPTFVLLAGVSASLQRERGKTRAELAYLLFTRGLWLIALELTVLSFAQSFSAPYPLMFLVIWAIGASMIGLSALVWLPRWTAFAVGCAIIALHNLFDPISPASFGGVSWLWIVFNTGGPILLDGQLVGIVGYPVLPWFGVMALGYGLGGLFSSKGVRNDAAFLAIGAGAILAFVVLRFLNAYGDPRPWIASPDPIASTMNFFNVAKYPPSLLFVLVTLGAVFCLLPLLRRASAPITAMLATFGAAPLFYYVTHFFLTHLLAIAANAAMGRDPAGMVAYMQSALGAPERLRGLGFSLPYVYVTWIAVLAVLFPACRWWANLKARRRDWWLSYL